MIVIHTPRATDHEDLRRLRFAAEKVCAQLELMASAHERNAADIHDAALKESKLFTATKFRLMVRDLRNAMHAQETK